MHTGRWIGDAHPEVAPPGEGRWIARPRKPLRIPFVFRWGFVLTQVPNVVRGCLQETVGRTVSWVAFVLILSLWIAATLGLKLRARRVMRGLLERLAVADGSFGEQYPVEATITAAGKSLVTDHGVVWFDEGLVGFSGASSSFVLAASDFRLEDLKNLTHPLGPDMPQFSLKLRNAPREASIALQSLPSDRASFGARLARFVAQDAPPTGERFWPPLAPYSEAVVRAGKVSGA